jgi:hypothetical protein
MPDLESFPSKLPFFSNYFIITYYCMAAAGLVGFFRRQSIKEAHQQAARGTTRYQAISIIDAVLDILEDMSTTPPQDH